MMRVAVMISGRGSNLDALIKAQSHHQIVHVISDNFEAPGIQLAQAQGIKTTCIRWRDKAWAETQAASIIESEQVELVVLAGFMRILSADFVNRFKQRIINIHPSLLPLYPGLNTHQRALDDAQTVHGATVHYVDEQLDHGPIIGQTTITITANDTAQDLESRLLPKEHKLLTHCVGLIAQHSIYWEEDRLMQEDQPLQKPLVIN